MHIPEISVIIVNFNAGKWLARSVQSVIDQDFKNFECFILDNNSTDGSLDHLPSLDERFHIIKSDVNLGFAAGNNLAAKKAKGTWLALLNPDAFARKDWLSSLLKTSRLKSNVTMVGSTQHMALEDGIFDGTGDELHAFGIAYRSGFGKKIHAVADRETFAPCGAGAFLLRESFEQLGGFDETFFCYFEDIDLAYRMRLNGGICVQSASAIIDHVSSGISGRASEFAVYHGTRNRIWAFLNNTPVGLMPFLLPCHVAANLFILFWSLFRPGRFKPTWQGVKEGFLSRPHSLRPQVKRKISYLTLLKSFGWSPIKVYKRLPVRTKPITKIKT